MGECDDSAVTAYIGPAGWSYRDWVGPVYPEGKRIDQLLTIAGYFDCIELNSSFYRVPGERLVSSWARRLSGKPRFKFTIKAWRRFTHERACESGDVQYFIHSFDPLAGEDRIGAFLLQFPWSFRYNEEGKRYLGRLAGMFRDVPTAVEVRHGTWNSPEALRHVSEVGLAFCNIDQPVIGNSIPPTDHVTNDRLGYIRLHGRNMNNWFNESAGRDERYNYLYRENELVEWRDRARKILGRVKNLFIITNNHFRGQALANALQIRSLMDGNTVDVPPALGSSFPVLRGIMKNRPAQGDLLDDT